MKSLVVKGGGGAERTEVTEVNKGERSHKAGIRGS